MSSLLFTGAYPRTRLRRNRTDDWSRRLVAESHLSVNDLIWPLFVIEGEGKTEDVSSMPGVKRYSIDLLLEQAKEASELGIPAIALFPVVPTEKKTEQAEEAYDLDNLICRAIREIKKNVPDIGIIGDVALEPYTIHGQDGVVEDGYVVNDKTLEILGKQALVLAEAGCDIVAPSDMMDGRIGYIRDELEANHHQTTKILAYAAKYASHFYGPFREAAGSAKQLKSGNKYSYQMDVSNGNEALREIMLDVEEGADMIMVKPGMPYLDVIQRSREYLHLPLLAYQVSGEYSMMKAADAQGWLNYKEIMLESLKGFKRAGVSAILTYAAKDVAKWLKHDMV